MLNLYPNIKTKLYVHANAACLLVVVCCCFTVEKYPLTWILLVASLIFMAPALVDFVYLVVLLTLLIASVVLLFFKIDITHLSDPLSHYKRTAAIKIQNLFCKLPLGKYNIFDLGLASSIVDYANSMGLRAAPLDYNSLISGPMIPLYQQAVTVLEYNKLSERADLVLVDVLLARELYRAGSAASALQSLNRAADIHEQLSDKEKNESADTSLLLADCFLFLRQADQEKGSRIAVQTLSLIEHSPVDQKPKDQLVLLARALNVVSQAYKAVAEDDQAASAAQRSAVLTAALKSKGIVV